MSKKTLQRPISGLLAAFSIVLLSACGGGGGGSASFPPIAATPAPAAEAPKTPEPAPVPAPVAPQQCRVLIYGDSLIGDPWLTEKVPERMRRLRPAWTIIDRAVGGQRWEQGAPRLWNTPDLSGAVVVLEWGVNDSKLLAPLTIVPEAIAKVKAEGGVPVLTGVVNIPGQATASYDAELQRYAIEGGAAWASWNERQITTFDSTHPDQASTDLLVDDLINTIEKETPCMPV